MTWINIVLELILFTAIIYVLVVANDLRKTSKRITWVLNRVETPMYEAFHKLSDDLDSQIRNLNDDLDSQIRNLNMLNIAYNGSLVKMEELIRKGDAHEPNVLSKFTPFDGSEDDLK